MKNTHAKMKNNLFLCIAAMVVGSASAFQIDGWTWHYFISDASGDCASLAFIVGVWKTKPAVTDDDLEFEIRLRTNKSAVSGEIVFNKGESVYPISHIGLLGNRLTFTYKNKRGYLLDVQATINSNQLTAHLQTTEDDAGTFVLYK